MIFLLISEILDSFKTTPEIVIFRSVWKVMKILIGFWELHKNDVVIKLKKAMFDPVQLLTIAFKNLIFFKFFIVGEIS